MKLNLAFNKERNSELYTHTHTQSGEARALVDTVSRYTHHYNSVDNKQGIRPSKQSIINNCMLFLITL